ncbi:uncharacterized protein LOC5508662 isoform X7 [Nematostella vectensis]|uniref:uncharacterized protein LOC5508662 isoform X7 n=1 Tax=Nematostella vectensis TaxID=45351 RepID=UPI0020779064|nr:uncharacterized protein LOC5508662 isoform X7 [Nematostella vectensis]
MSTSGSPPKKIHFEVGAKLEAMDYTQNWYPAKICRVDSHGKKALIHFEGWNHRFDEWIAFNSERLRPHRGGHLEHKEEKTQQQDVCDYKEWRNGDRILAKWQDCKFYPAKILKINTDGSFEVLFYDGFKKTVQRSNIKPDNSKKTFPVDKELAMEKSERIERRAKLAAGRAERARKRSKELAGISPSPPTSKRRERGRRTKAEEEMGMTSESSMSSPAEPPQEVPEADEVPVDTANMATDQTEREKAPETMETSQPITQNAKTPEIETSTHKETWSEKQEKEVLTGKNSSRDKTSGEIHSVKNTTKANETSANEESLPELDISNEDPKSLSKDMLNVNKQNTDTIDTNSLSGGCRGPQNDVDLEEDRKVSSREASASENIHEVEKPLSSASAQDKDHYSSVEPNTDKAKEVSRIRNIIQSVKETIANENNNIQAMVSSICKQADLRTDLAATASRQGMIKPQRKPKSTGRGGSRGAMNPRKRALRGSGRNSMSPRGYGYSMAFMDPVSKPESSESLATTSSSPTTSASITASSSPVLHQAEKEASCVNVETKETKTASGLLPDSEELNEVLEADEETVVVIPADPVNTATASSTSPATTLSKPKTQNFHKKKMRLDQITDKLSAQCKSQIEAAASSPSAFQVAKPHTPTPPPPTQQPAPQPTMQTTPTHSSTSHTPPTPISAPYPVEGYPPPLIYAPMSGACCTNPHCHGQHQAMYANPPPSHRGPLPPPHGMHGMGPSPHLHVPSSPYVMYQPGVPCSCSGCTGGVYRPTGPITHPESALARLIQCEQRILHSGPRPSIPHYREAPTPHSPWLAHGHPHQQYMSLPSKREEMWRQQEAERSALMRNTPSLSPTSESAMLQNWRQKLERPLTTLKLNQPDSSPASTPASIPESANNTPLHPSLSSKQETSVPKSDNNTVVTTQAASVTPATPSASSADATTPSSMSPQQRTSAMTPNGTPVSMVGGKGRKGKDSAPLAPKELIIEMDHNKYKCQVPGCDKSFRKESGLEYHKKYYHTEGDKPLKRKRSSASMRSDGTPETSPDGPPYLGKRRCHRSSAPGQLTSESNPYPPDSEDSMDGPPGPMEPISIKVEPSAKEPHGREVELEIEPGTEAEAMFFGPGESMDIDEDEDEGDVIRCRCNLSEEGGFMIQCEQCLTWQHSECVGLTELTVPSKYLCYVCSNPKGLRRHAKYRNDFDWFKKGILAHFSYLHDTLAPEYNSERILATHDVMVDLHCVASALDSLRIRIHVLRNKKHPDLMLWRKPVPKTDQQSECESSPGANTDRLESPARTTPQASTPYGTSLLMVKPDTLPNGLDDPPRPALSALCQNGGVSNENNSSSAMNGKGHETDSDGLPHGSAPRTEGVPTDEQGPVSEEGLGRGEEEAISPLPPLVPVGGSILQVFSSPKESPADKGGADDKAVLETSQDTRLSRFSPNPLENSESSKDSESFKTSDEGTAHPSKESKETASEDSLNVRVSIDTSVSMDTSVAMETEEACSQTAMMNLLDDIDEMHADLETLMDQIERQIEVLEGMKEESRSPPKPDMRKLVKDLARIKRLAIHVG